MKKEEGKKRKYTPKALSSKKWGEKDLTKGSEPLMQQWVNWEGWRVPSSSEKRGVAGEAKPKKIRL